MKGSPSFEIIVGASEVNRLLPGAIEPALFGLGSNTAIHPLYINPRLSVITPDGIPNEWVIVTQFPS